MADRRDSVLTSEKLGLFGIIIGLLGIATAYIAFGLVQLKIFEAYLPYIFIFVGAVYIILSLILVSSIRGGGSITGGVSANKASDVFQSLISAVLNKAKILASFMHKYKMPIFVIVAFGAGVLIASGGSGFNFNFNLPNIQLPILNTQDGGATTLLNFGSKKVPTQIVDFSASKAEGTYSFSFSVADNDSVKMNVSGNASLKIIDTSSKVLFEESFEVFEAEYSSGIYIRKVEESKVSKTKSSPGTASIKFTPSGGSELTSNASVDVPIYTVSELEEIYENDYQAVAVTVGKTVSKYAFDVTVSKAGFFTKVVGASQIVYYRVDLSVKNNFAVETEFKTTTAKLTVGGSSYSPDAEGTFKTGNIKGKTVKEGYLLFKNVPSTISGGIKVTAGSTTANEDVFYTFDI